MGCSSALAVTHSALDTAYAADGKSLAVTDATAATVVLIDASNHQITRTIKLTAPPAALAWANDGKQLWVSESGRQQIAEIDPASGTITRHLACGRYPRGLAVATQHKLLLAADWGMNTLTAIDLSNGKIKANIPVGCQPTSVAITPDESLALVSNLLPHTAATAPDHAAEVSIIDLKSLKSLPPIKLPLGSTNVRGIAINRDGSTAYVVHTLGRFNLPTTQLDRGWVITNALSIIDVKSSKLTATVLLDQVMDGAADPWGVAINPAGTRLFVSLAGVHQLAVIDLERLPSLLKDHPESLTSDLAALYRSNLIQRIDLPAQGPRGLAISPNGQSLAIAGYFSGNLVFADDRGSQLTPIALGPQEKPDLARQGEVVFHDANRCFQRWLSCATCHPDARADGLNWDLLNDGLGNPKNAKSMVWSDRTPPVMSHGVRDNMEVAAKAGFIHILFTEPNPQDLQAVIAYLKSLEPITSPHRNADGSLSQAAARGKKLFDSRLTSCSQCHPAPLFTNLSSFDVGTANPNDRKLHEFDTPSLIEAWRTPPYLHDGSAATLKEVITRNHHQNQHGSTSQLSAQQIADLTAYLESL